MSSVENNLTGEMEYNFHYAKALKAGRLRFPLAAPSVLKHTALQRAGEYLSNRSDNIDLAVSVLLSVLIRENNHPYNERVTFKEKIILWSWSDQDDIRELDNYLRTVPLGLCRHTQYDLQIQNFVQKQNLAIDSSQKKKVFKVNGVCARQECRMISTEVLLQTFLNSAEFQTPQEKHDAISTLLSYRWKSFKQHIVYDEDLPNFKNCEIIVRGIETRTLRKPGYSNGVQSLLFQVISFRNSVLEQAKNNVLRPITFQAKRQTAKREFILLQLSHDDRDTLESWRTLIRSKIGKTDYNMTNKSAFSESESNVKRLASSTSDAKQKPMNFELDNTVPRYYNLCRTGNPLADTGMQDEIITGSFYTSLSVQDLFRHMIVLKNEFEPWYTTRFDKYVMGTLGSKNGQDNFVALQCLPEPPMETNEISQFYGINKQSFLVRALKEEPIEYQNWAMTKAPLVSAFSGSYLISSLLNFVSEFSLSGRTNDYDTMSSDQKLFQRKFNLKKVFYSQENNISDEMKSFCVSYSSVAQETKFNERPELRISKSDGITANIGQVFIKVEENDLTGKEESTVLGYTERQLEKLNRRKPATFKMILALFKAVELEDAGAMAKFSEQLSTTADAAVKDWKMVLLQSGDETTVFSGRTNVALIEEKISAFVWKSSNKKEFCRLKLLQALNQVVLHPTLKDNVAPAKKRNVMLLVSKMLFEVVHDTNKLFVVKAAFSIWEKVLSFSKVFKDVPDFKAQCDIHNVAAFHFAESIETLISLNYCDEYSHEIIRLAISSISNIISAQVSSKLSITVVMLLLIGSVQAALKRMIAEMEFEENQERLDKESSRYKQLYNVLTTGSLKAQVDELAKLKALGELVTKVNQQRLIKMRLGKRAASDGKFVEAIADMTWQGRPIPPELKEIGIVDTLYEQKRSQTGNVDDNEMVSFWKEYNRDVNGQRLYSEESGEGATPSSAAESKSHDERFISKLYSFNKSMRSDASDNFDSIVSCIVNMKHELNEILSLFREIEDTSTKVSIELIGNAKDLFSPNLALKYPKLASNWCESFLNDIKMGVKQARSDRASGYLKKSDQVRSEIERCDLAVNNDGLRFFFFANVVENHDLDFFTKENKNSVSLHNRAATTETRSDTERIEVVDGIIQLIGVNKGKNVYGEDLINKYITKLPENDRGRIQRTLTSSNVI